MLTTPLTAVHESLGAKMVDFAGYIMPLQYTSIKEEHMQVREKVGVFDVSHMGEFIVKGKDASKLIQKISSNDVSKITNGQCQYSCIPNADGGIVDDFLIYKLHQDQCAEGEEAYMLVVNASNIEKDWNWIAAANSFDCRMINISSQTGLLAVQGPDSIKALQQLTDYDLSSMEYYHFGKMKIAGCDNILISNTGYTGAGGFEIYGLNADIVKIWNAIFEQDNIDVKPVGLGARDTLRLEMGFCLYGNDITDTTSPIEAGLAWITKTKKEDQFFSKEIFQQHRKLGVDRKLVGFVSDEKRVPRKDYIIRDINNQEIGVVTSGSMSPCLDKPIGMGYVKKEFATLGNDILIDTGRKTLKATIVKPPFVNK